MIFFCSNNNKKSKQSTVAATNGFYLDIVANQFRSVDYIIRLEIESFSQGITFGSSFWLIYFYYEFTVPSLIQNFTFLNFKFIISLLIWVDRWGFTSEAN